jgi:Trypsin Inhibitor like cysteine rich domain
VYKKLVNVCKQNKRIMSADAMLQQILFQRVWNRNALIWTSLTGALKPIVVSRVYCFLLQILIVFIQYTYVSAAECPANEVFHDCFQHKCERSCSNPRKTCSVGNICHSGCFCKDGYVRKGDSCVLPSQCDDCIIVLNHIAIIIKHTFFYRCLRGI